MAKKAIGLQNMLEWLCTTFIIILMMFFLFYTGEHGFTDLLTAKYSAFKWICGGFIVISTLLILEGLLIGSIKLEKTSFLQIAVLVYLLFTWISALLSEHFPKTVVGATRCEGALTVTIYCLIFLIVSMYGKVHRHMLTVLSVCSVAFGIICILQLYGKNPFWLYPEGYDYFDAHVAYSGEYLGTIGNTDLVAAFLCLLIPIFLTEIIKFGIKRKYYLLLPLAVLTFVLVKMNVLAGIVGILFGYAIIIPVICFKSHRAKRICIIAIIALAFAALLLIYLVDLPFELPHQMHMMMHGSVEGVFGSGRIHIWKSVLERVPKHLLFGSGPDTMAYEDIEPFSRFDETLGITLVSKIDVAHNEYLNVLSQQGILAFIAYMAIVIYTVFKWFKHANKSTAAILGSALICYFIQAFFSFSMCITAPFFWVILGLFDNATKDS